MSILSQSDYLRMAGILAAVVEETGSAACRACVSFSVAGAVILRHVFQKEAYPVAGAAFYRLDGKNDFTLAFGNASGDQVTSNKQAFHCWIMCDGFVIDLLAPLFPESVKSFGRPEIVSSKMFQRSLLEIAPSPFDLAREGDFFIAPNRALSNELFSAYTQDPSYARLVRACVTWFEKEPGPNGDLFTVPRRHGEQGVLKPRRFVVRGSW